MDANTCKVTRAAPGRDHFFRMPRLSPGSSVIDDLTKVELFEFGEGFRSGFLSREAMIDCRSSGDKSSMMSAQIGG